MRHLRGLWAVGLLGPLALAAAGRADEAAAVKLVEKLGGTADPKQAGKPVVAVSLRGTKAADADVKALKALGGLKYLNLGNTRVTGAGLHEFKNLRELHLDGTQVTDAGLKELTGLRSLEILYLNNTAVTGAGLKELKGQPRLRYLNLYNTPVTDAGLKELKECRGLQELLLGKTRVTDAGVEELRAALPKLKITR